MPKSLRPALAALDTMVDNGWMEKVRAEGVVYFKGAASPNALDMPDFIGLIHIVSRACDGKRLYVVSDKGSLYAIQYCYKMDA